MKRDIQRKYTVLAGVVVMLLATCVMSYFASTGLVAVLEPRGIIAQQQRDLFVGVSMLSLAVIIPVFIMTFYIAFTYREGNQNAKYTPEFDRSLVAESVWWGIPLSLIIILSIIIWSSSHALDPFKPIASNKDPVHIQVVALQWRWLFLYPDQKLATLNYVHLPEDRPIEFTLTADAPMNSFWIPELGGQVYAMPGMSTKLHLLANEPGVYKGSSANLSGKGFAGMRFKAQVVSEQEYIDWAKSMQQEEKTLDYARYSQLAKPTTESKTASFRLADAALYDTIIAKYMAPGKAGHTEGTTNGAVH